MSNSSASAKQRSKGDSSISEEDADIYDEACQEIRMALDAYAVAVVDLSQFHLFYPAYQSSSTNGSSIGRGSSVNSRTTGVATTYASFGSSYQGQSRGGNSNASGPGSVNSGETPDAYAKPTNRKHARQTYATSDPTAPSRTPQVLFVPTRRKTDPKRSRYTKEPEAEGQDDVGLHVFERWTC
jgi:hypothetical protein